MRGFYYKAIILSLLYLLVLSCNNNEWNTDSSVVDEKVEGVPTYANLTVSLLNVPPMTKAAEYDSGLQKEYSVSNIIFVFFDRKGNLEYMSEFGASDFEPDPSYTSAVSGSETCAAYILKKAINIMSGDKTIVVLANVTDALKAKLNKLKTYQEYKDFKIESGTSNSYLSVLGMRAPSLDSCNMSFSNVGLLMTAEKRCFIEAGVTESEANARVKNYISGINLKRVLAKVTLKIEGLGGDWGDKLVANNQIFNFYVRILNIPVESYLLQRESIGISPFFNQDTIFTNWECATNYTRYAEEPYDAIVGKKWTFYIPENNFSICRRGCVTFLEILYKARIKKEDNTLSLGHYWAFYNEQTNTTSYKYLSKQPTILFKRLEWDYNVRGERRVQKLVVEYVNDIIDRNDFSEDRIIDMPSRPSVLTKDQQDDELRANGITAPVGYYLFAYRRDRCDPGAKEDYWYDTFQLYYYTGNGFERDRFRSEFKGLFYTGGADHFYRVNIEDTDVGVNSPARYWIKRNAWYDIKITGISRNHRDNSDKSGFDVSGFTSVDDLHRAKDDVLNQYGLEVDVKVKDWYSGGNYSDDAGKW